LLSGNPRGSRKTVTRIARIYTNSSEHDSLPFQRIAAEVVGLLRKSGERNRVI
jgi:hypothetical protein